LISKGEVYGLLHLSDKRKGVFSSSFIKFFEGLGASIGVALARKKDEERLRQSEEKYRLLAENAKDGIYIHSDSGFEYVNPALETILGLTAEELTGRSIEEIDLIHPEDRNKVKRERKKRKSAKDRTSRFSFRIVDKDGQIKHTEVNTVALPGDKSRALGILRDVSDWVNLESELKGNILQMENMVWGTVQALAQATETRDPYTAGHQNRVARLALAIAEELQLDEGDIDGIRMAGLVHDIGKIQVPAEILSKPGELTETEFNLIKAHTQIGYDILKTIEFPFPVAKTVLQHHERLDGSGYPSGLKGEQILLGARILAVSDVVEAMASYRPYRPALGLDKALEEILRYKGTLYDEQVVDACLNVFQTKSTIWGQNIAPHFTPDGKLR
jgi:PAS domain S-box-containing protein/putative nucleotidyltransferase with HDIG domain